MPNISVSYSSVNTEEAAKTFASLHELTCIPLNVVKTPLVVIFNEDHVELRDNDKNISVHVDFTSGELAHRQLYGGGRGQAIAKAIGLKQGSQAPYVLDVTAGLAKDAFVLANLGCKVLMIEQSPILVEMVNNAIRRAKTSESFTPLLNNGFEIILDNSIDYLKSLVAKEQQEKLFPDVIYLDPMYPDRKKAASVKKNMQLLQKLHSEETQANHDQHQLLLLARKAAKKRIVVKRPKGAENIASLKPAFTVESKKTRYDIYLPEKAN